MTILVARSSKTLRWASKSKSVAGNRRTILRWRARLTGLRLDQETAAEDDAENFDPEVDLRDYAAVAASLPVFCVSSRAFQKLSGRLQKDGFISDGFLTPDDTEIPQLQEHAKKLTEADRAANCRKFLHDLVHLLNSMKMWAANIDNLSNRSEGRRKTRRSACCAD